MTNDGSYQAYAQQEAAKNLPGPRVSGAGANPGRDTFSQFYRSDRPPEERPPRAPHFTITSRQKVADGEMVAWRLTYYDFSGGLAQNVDLGEGAGANMASGTFDLRKRGFAVQPLSNTEEIMGSSAPAQHMLVQSHWENKLVLASGGTADKCLFMEFAEDNPLMTIVVHNPGAGELIMWHGPLTFKDTTRFFISRVGAAPRAYASPGGVLAGAMEASLASCCGWMEMPVNVSPGAALKLFITMSGDIFSMTSGQDYNAAPSLVGSAADRFKLPLLMQPLKVIPWGRGLRAVWKAPEFLPIGFVAAYDRALYPHPRDLSATGVKRRIRLPHCDVTGLDWDEIKVPELRYITNAEAWRDGLICTDDTEIVWKPSPGGYKRVYLNEQMPKLTDRKRVVVDFGDNGRDLIIRIDEIAINGTSGATTTYDVSLNGDTWALSPASPVVTLTGLTGRRSLAGVGGGIPIGQGTRYIHGMARDNFFHRPLPRPGQSGWDLRGDYNFDVCSGTLPDTVLPEPFCYLTSVADAVLFKGYLPPEHNLSVDWGKSHEDGTVAATGSVATFSGPINRASRRYPHKDNQARFQDVLSASFAVTRDSSAYEQETVNLTSLALEGHTLIPHGTDFSDAPKYDD